MTDLLLLTTHLLTLIATLIGKGGARSIVADSLLLKQQLLIIRRSQRRSPRLTPLDRFLLGFWSLFLNLRQINRAAVIVRPSTLLKFHRLLRKRLSLLVEDASGQFHDGIDAYVLLLRRVPRLRLLGWLIELPILKPTLIYIYKFSVRRRLARDGRL